MSGWLSRSSADVEDGRFPAQADGPLIRAAQAGDREAFAALVRRYQTAVAAAAYALTGQISLSQDVAQETFVVTWRRFDNVDPANLRSWLLAVARRESLRALRKQRTQLRESGISATAGDFPSFAPSPLDRMIDREEEVLLWRALKR